MGGRTIPEYCEHGKAVCGGDFLEDEYCAQCGTLDDYVEELQGALRELLDWFDRGFAHWEYDNPITGEHESGDPQIMVIGREQWEEFAPAYRRLLNG